MPLKFSADKTSSPLFNDEQCSSSNCGVLLLSIKLPISCLDAFRVAPPLLMYASSRPPLFK